MLIGLPQTGHTFAPETERAPVLSAGWDSRAWESPAGAKVHIFKVDKSPTQQAKRTAFGHAGLSLDHVTFVEPDFNQKSWPQTLSEQDFNTTLPTSNSGRA